MPPSCASLVPKGNGMASMEYDDAAAERLEAVYRGRDVIAQRADTLRRLALAPGEHVIDIGSGPGFLTADLARAVGPEGRAFGADLSAQMVARAKARSDHPALEYVQADATSLPVPDDSFDVAVSVQVAEYVPDIPGFCAEFRRVLKPGGRGLIVATDWDAMIWHSDDPERMQRVLRAFAPHCADSRLPRTLGPRLLAAGLEIESITLYAIVNATPYEGSYSAGIIPFIQAYVADRGTIPGDELAAWVEEQRDLAEAGRYFFSTGRFNFAVRKPG